MWQTTATITRPNSSIPWWHESSPEATAKYNQLINKVNELVDANFGEYINISFDGNANVWDLKVDNVDLFLSRWTNDGEILWFESLDYYKQVNATVEEVTKAYDSEVVVWNPLTDPNYRFT